nr:terminase gpA endonuclease subunit [Afifella sp. IM 167]
MVPSVWAQQLVVPDGPRAGTKWDPSLTPYVPEIIDAMGPDSPHNIAAVRKSAQTGVSVAAMALCLSYADRAPCRIGFVLPGQDAINEFSREKLGPAIEATPVLKKKIRPQTSRSAQGSTGTYKRFPGGSLLLLNANSAADLRQKTLKIGVADEIDEWEDDLNGQGDPFELLKGRFTSHHATGEWRLLALSTPTEDGESKIDELFEEGDQRFWHVDCPQCGTSIRLQFEHLKFNRRPPYQAHYVAQCCGGVIEHHEKAALVREGRFVAANSEGLYPSFHVDALTSLVTTWDMIAEGWWTAHGDERKVKAFFNTVLGLAYRMRGDAPDHERLMERRDRDLVENVVPPRGLLLVCGADVQHSGIWAEVVAFAPDRQSWCVAARWLEGDTADPNGAAWQQLAALYDERFLDAFGQDRQIDALAVDAGDGQRMNQALAFVRSRARAYATKGMAGWTHPAIGSPSRVDINLRGKRIRRGASLWPIGTWPLKAEFYSNLRKPGIAAGQEVDPAGYCHFGGFLGENYFKQITAEYLADVKFRGRTRREWRPLREDNHLLDCRIMAMAMAEYLGLSRMTPERWAQLAASRGVPAELADPDLFAPEAVKLAAKPQAPKTAGDSSSFEERRNKWRKRSQ